MGTIRCIKNEHYYKLSRLAVLEQYRKFRFGRALVLALHDHVKRNAKADRELTSPVAIPIATTHIQTVAPTTKKILTDDDLFAGNYLDVVRVHCHSQIPVKAFYAR